MIIILDKSANGNKPSFVAKKSFQAGKYDRTTTKFIPRFLLAT